RCARSCIPTGRCKPFQSRPVRRRERSAHDGNRLRAPRGLSCDLSRSSLPPYLMQETWGQQCRNQGSSGSESSDLGSQCIAVLSAFLPAGQDGGMDTPSAAQVLTYPAPERNKAPILDVLRRV